LGLDNNSGTELLRKLSAERSDKLNFAPNSIAYLRWNDCGNAS